MRIEEDYDLKYVLVLSFLNENGYRWCRIIKKENKFSWLWLFMFCLCYVVMMLLWWEG